MAYVLKKGRSGESFDGVIKGAGSLSGKNVINEFRAIYRQKEYISARRGIGEVTPPAVRIAMIGIALGLAVMILSVAIVIGFKKEVRNKVIGFGSHIQITNFDSNSSYESQPIAVSDTLLNALDAFPGIRHVEKFATKLGILKTDQDFKGLS